MLYFKKSFKINDAIFYLKPEKVKQIKIIMSKSNKIENKGQRKLTKQKVDSLKRLIKCINP